MKKFIYCLLLSLFPLGLLYSQEIIEHRGDTMIVISPTNLKTINSIIIDLESSEKIINLQKNLIIEDSIKISNLDSIVYHQRSIIRKKEDYYVRSINNLERVIKKEKRKNKIWTCTLSLVAVVLGVFAICK